MDQQNNFPASFKHKSHSTLTENNLKSLNNDYEYQPPTLHHLKKQPTANLVPSTSQPAINSFQQQVRNDPAISRHTPTDPIYYNMNASSPLLVQQTSWNTTSTPSPQAYSNGHYHHHHHPGDGGMAAGMGHTNPTYQHSTPNLVEAPEMEEYYQANRPPSVRSSYSNFHGTRPLSYNPNPQASTSSSAIANSNNRNVFVGLNQQQHQQQHQQQQQQPTASRQQVYYNKSQAQPQTIPQVPTKKAPSRFLHGAPPAYAYNHHTPPDSETTM